MLRIRNRPRMAPIKTCWKSAMACCAASKSGPWGCRLVKDKHLLTYAYGIYLGNPYKYTGWWYTHPSEKYEFVSWDYSS